MPKQSHPHAAALRTEFLGWERTALVEAAQRLSAHYRQGKTLDLGNVLVVMPGQRAGRRLLELLAFLAQDENLLLTPPRVVTEGHLPELLYTAQKPFADDITQDLAWAQALRELPEEHRRHVVPHPPGPNEALRWLQLGKILRNLHIELAADGLDFPDVGNRGRNVAGFTEAQRWLALAGAQERYLALLTAQGLWDTQTARLTAIERREIQTTCDIVLLGTVDLNNMLRQMLDQIAARVTAYIVAPESLADHFDRYGCLVPKFWCRAQIPIDDEHFRQVDGPVEQADAVADWLRQMAQRYRVDEVAIGVTDEALVPQLQRQLEQSDVTARWVEGIRVGETGPFRLLEAAAQCAGQQRYDDLAALLRHPDLEKWLSHEITISGPALPAQLDEFYNARLPSRLRANQVFANDKRWPNLAAALAKIEDWLKDAAGLRPLRQWGDIFLKMLATIYGDTTLNLDKPDDALYHKVLKRMVQACEHLSDLPVALDTTALAATDAFQVALAPLAAEALPPPANPDAVEILGWLELPLDDSPALIVTSFNEGFVPTAAKTDGFLPDRLRRELGVEHDERRYARDAYATTVLCRTRQQLRFIFARRNTNNDPLHPSRLLFACADDVLVRRAQELFRPPPATSRRRTLLAHGLDLPAQSKFEVPKPEVNGEKITQISVSRFKDYIACPYRYYLRHVRKLQAVDDSARELDGSRFGGLLHRVLGAFGRQPDGLRHSNRAGDIFDFLSDQLDNHAQQDYGRDRHRPAVRLQLEQARLRLQAFAVQQALLVREGWRIIYAEDEERDELAVVFMVDAEPIDLIGRIDRIDWHDKLKTLRIIDYKTADKAVSPEKTHRQKEAWIDLQLPLYRQLWRQLALKVRADCLVELAYFNLPKDVATTGIAAAEWSDADLAAAVEEACRVIRDLRKGVFWPPNDPPKHSDDLAAICLDNVRAPAGAEDEEDAP